MSKPEWNEDTPKWANWLAQDKSGHWYWYENEPDLGRSVWHHAGKAEKASADHKHWPETLEPRP